MLKRCAWCGTDTDYQNYHDKEWGVPVHSDQLLFEFLVLEGAQAGLSWLTILKKRTNYRQAFDNFSIEKIVAYTDEDIERLLQNPGIVRNRLKIQSAIKNAHAAQAITAKYGSLDAFLWRYVDGKPKQNTWKTPQEVPVSTAISDAMSKDLKKRGFSFVGSTICYAFMQAVGMVNDHTTDCFRHKAIHGMDTNR